MLKFKFSDQKPATAIERRQRSPMDIFIETIELQTQAVKAEQSGKPLLIKKQRYAKVDGQSQKVEKEIKVRPWWWSSVDENGKTSFNITMRYGSQIIAIEDKPTIVAGPDLNAVEKTLVLLLDAAKKNDEQLVKAVNAAKQRSRRNPK
ncbi:hypothetical protein [Magnetovibrio blakemorei]|uniref:Uncharacterized protein n=1 Tax=Magnetovibrio blakemorei TaxID=28181 RepID=A0A1E5Q478_9PROT|nr:hypothetical protein [Magnetovibrio blakemorei]OEJ64941.1 hypothetical protein BEN30_15850 [Magnetovibrio blakemorei]